MNALNQLVIFSIDEQRYALPLSFVERILRVVKITPLPKIPDIVPGVIIVKGTMIPVINIRRFFNLPEREIDLSDQLIITRTPKRNIALLVDNVSGVQSEIEAANPKDIPGQMEHIKGMARLEEEFIPILDPSTILSPEELKSLDAVLKEGAI